MRRKISAIKSELKGKVVLLVDDSIVRGTTCRGAINIVRDAGAKKIYVASCAPEVRYALALLSLLTSTLLIISSRNAHIYGIDLASPMQMVACNRDNAAICKDLDCDGIIFQTFSNFERPHRYLC